MTRGTRTARVLALLALAAGVIGPAPVDAQPRAWPLGHGEHIVLDGRLDEPAWARAPVHDAFVQYRPVDRQPPPEGYRTTVQVLVQDDALVVGIRAFDPRPSEIRGPLVRRDQVRRDQDFVAVVIDATGDRRSAQFLRVNAAGVLADGMYLADGDVEDFAPDFDFDAAAHRMPDGYAVEVRLPFMALRYPYRGGLPWRLMVARSVPRESGTLLLSAPLTQDAATFIAELQVVGGLSDLESRVRDRGLLTIIPEFTLRSVREHDGPRTESSRRASVGADIKWRPRADWVFDATLNPDFSQVELDEPQLAGNTRFALSVPEKRPFFLESTDVLDLPLAAFYSRSVTDPRHGLRATWRASDADATALTLRDRGGGTVLLPRPFDTGEVVQVGPSQASLLRARLHRGDAQSRWSLGALLSDRDYGQGRGNRVVGADLGWYPSAETRWHLQALTSSTTALFDDEGKPVLTPNIDGHRWELGWFHRSPGWNLTADAGATSGGFRNDNGFVEQAGVRFLQTEIIRRFGETVIAPFGAGSGMTAYELETYLRLRQAQTTSGQTIEQVVHPGLWLLAARDTEAWVEARFDARRVQATGPLRHTRVLAGSYSVNPAPWFTRLTLELSHGDRIDMDPRVDRVGRGSEWMVEAKLKGRMGRFGLESEARMAAGTIDSPRGGRALADRTARWLAVVHANARDSLRFLWQGQWVDRETDPASGIALAERYRQRSASLVFQHRFGPGRSLSIGASRATTTDEPARREVFVKSALVF